ncbi:hypothetical protein HQ560_17905, partial [bacterium]|nr:hypothetical protein [bacterium]
TDPNEKRLREFYKQTGTFHGDPRKVPEDIAADRGYWGQVIGLVHGRGRFTDTEKDLKQRYFSMWAGEMDGKFPDWDDFQIAQAGFRLAADGDTAKWMKRLDGQFDRYQKKDDHARVVKWIRLYGKHKAKALSYYQKIDFAKMTNRQMCDLMYVLYDVVQNAEMARNLFRKLKMADMSDGEKVGVAHNLYRRDGERVPVALAFVDDKDMGQAELLRYYHFVRDAKKGVPVADKVISMPKYAKDATWKKAELLHWSKQYKEAIATYQRADNPPTNLWRIADCYVALGKVDTAIAQLKEVEAFFKDQAPEAAMRIAHLWQKSGKKKQQIASLRGVLKKYPNSGQSSRAHEELEALGIRIGGGVDAND